MSKEKELFENIATNIAYAMLECDDEERDEYLNEEFAVYWLESTDEWVVAFGNDVLYDGFETEKEAQEMYDKLDNKAHELFYELQK